jgi:parvulin-like peptidyl-prolyl isomerase
MKLSRLTLAVLVSALAVVASACGGGGGSGDVPEGAVAVVNGTEIARTELDQLMEQAKKAYESQNQEFPRAGTPEYRNVQAQYLAYLVQREEFEQEAKELGIEVTEKDIDKELTEFVKSRFEGKREAFNEALKAQGYTLEAFRETLRTSVLSQKLFDEVTKEVEVTDAEVQEYYAQNQQSYSTPESRKVRHILVSEKKGEEVDFPKSKTEADRLYAELENGADFAALAKAESDDPSSGENGGELTINRGQTVPEFDKKAFELEVGVVSEPVKTTYGYHLIEALGPVKEAKTTPLDEVRASIKSTLLQEKRTTFMTDWVEDLREEYDGKVSYAAGFEPPELPEETDTETETESATE